MVLKVKYKSKEGYSYFDHMPIVVYKYKSKSDRRWKENEVYVDALAYRTHRILYKYNVDEMKETNRLQILQSVVNEDYGGDVSKYMKDMVIREVLQSYIADRKDKVTNDIRIQFITNKWKTIEVNTEEANGLLEQYLQGN